MTSSNDPVSLNKRRER